MKRDCGKNGKRQGMLVRIAGIILALLIIMAPEGAVMAEDLYGHEDVIDLRIETPENMISENGKLFAGEDGSIHVFLFAKNGFAGISSVDYLISSGGMESRYRLVIKNLGESATMAADAAEFDNAVPDNPAAWTIHEMDGETVISISRNLEIYCSDFFSIRLSLMDMRGNYYSFQKDYELENYESSAEEEDQEESPEADQEESGDDLIMDQEEDQEESPEAYQEESGDDLIMDQEEDQEDNQETDQEESEEVLITDQEEDQEENQEADQEESGEDPIVDQEEDQEDNSGAYQEESGEDLITDQEEDQEDNSEAYQEESGEDLLAVQEGDQEETPGADQEDEQGENSEADQEESGEDLITDQEEDQEENQETDQVETSQEEENNIVEETEAEAETFFGDTAEKETEQSIADNDDADKSLLSDNYEDGPNEGDPDKEDLNESDLYEDGPNESDFNEGDPYEVDSYEEDLYEEDPYEENQYEDDYYENGYYEEDYYDLYYSQENAPPQVFYFQAPADQEFVEPVPAGQMPSALIGQKDKSHEDETQNRENSRDGNQKEGTLKDGTLKDGTRNTQQKDEKQDKEKNENSADGSVYDLSALKEINGRYLKTAPDLVILESNPNRLLEDSIRVTAARNGETFELEKGKDYTFRITASSASANTYQYTIPKEVFSQDGTYSVYLFSRDDAGNINSNEKKNAGIRFSVDNTNPIIIACPESEEQTEKGIRQIRIKDNVSLSDVEIYLGEKKLEYDTEGETYSFRVPSGSDTGDITIKASDLAGNRYERTLANYVMAGKATLNRKTNPVLWILLPVLAAGAGGTGWFLVRRRGKTRKEHEKF